MRRPIRPFVREFKNHSPKSSLSWPQTIEDADQVGTSQPVPDLGAFPPLKANYEDGREAALKAANEVFGKHHKAAPVQAAIPSPKIPTGRVLPSLVDKDDALAIRLLEADKKGRRTSGRTNAKTSSSIKRKKPTPPPATKVAKISADAAASDSSSQTSVISADRRERSSIQKRWVFKTELKAGQKWKRRLPRLKR